MATTGYPSDLSAAQWALIELHLPHSSQEAVLARPICMPSSMPSSIFFARVASGGCCRMIFLHGGRFGGIFGVDVKRGSGFGFTERSILSSEPRPDGERSRVS